MDVGTDKVRDSALDAGLSKEQLARSLRRSRSAPPRPARSGSPGRTRPSRPAASRPIRTRSSGSRTRTARSTTTSRRQAQAGLRRERGEQRHRRAEERRPAWHRYLGEDRPPGGGQDRNHRPEQVGLVRRLHPAAVHVDRHVAGGRPGQEAGLPFHARCGRPGDHPRCVVPAEIWSDYMREAMAGQPAKDFPAAGPIGDKVYGENASPTPTPTRRRRPRPRRRRRRRRRPRRRPAARPSDV